MRPVPRDDVPADLHPEVSNRSSARNASAKNCGALVPRETRRYACPVCGRKALDVTHQRRRDASGTTVLVYCHHCHAPRADIAVALGARENLLYRWPPSVFGDAVSRATAAGQGPAVSEGTVAGCVSALWTRQHAHALTYLRETRGLSDTTIREYQLGYDARENAIVLPVRDESGEVVAIKRRFLAPNADPKKANSPGPLRLYPNLPKRGWLLFVAGEIDALTGRQLGIHRAVSSTGGWLARHQVEAFAGRSVVLLPDVGEELAAEHQAAWLREVGCIVRIVHWPPGLPDGTDLNDWVVDYGGTRHALLALIGADRRTA
jgi:hypothetical protein